jgi:succinate dehydrogenase / fumarate reductase flavoprotein subunit
MSLSDTGMWTNQNLSYARAVADMVILAQAIIEGSIERKESRGSHYRTDFPTRNDERFLKSTVAAYDPTSGGCRISFEDVDTALVQPRARTYGKVEAPAGAPAPKVAVPASPDAG